MAAITKDTECYVGIPGEQFAYETTNFPGNKQILQSFYGDTDGAAEPPKDLVLLIGDKLGIALGQVIIDGGIEYQLMSFNVTVRESSGFLGWGQGTYREERRPVYVKSEIITLDAVWAEQERYKRLNKEKIATEAAAKKKQNIIDKLADGTTPQTGNAAGNSSLNLTTIVLIVFGFISVIIGGVLLWKGRQDKKNKQ
ncbi:hypothetical protein [Arcicella lustrica]|uniref:LPXTG cell wall anchor domain-containing protein n=1 Tax=Arcicella lustrica TaxID=2984196 RepID=A0ABU5SDM7_9BACT|nr:hypothetical protein [Arcicella sp. DC25W]MEA5425384.1 hypothetical protein [Arcicella sp. DC25W]